MSRYRCLLILSTILACLSLPASAQVCLPEWSDQFRGTDDLDGTVLALTVFDDDAGGPHAPAIFAGGVFTIAGSGSANRIVKWTGSAWEPLDDGFNAAVRALAVFDDDGAGPNAPALYAGGEFTMVGGAAASHIARWNGVSWTTLGNGVNGTVHALAVFDPDGAGPALAELHAGGSFTLAGGNPATGIARWNGSTWSAVSGSTNDDVFALAVVDLDGAGPTNPALFVGGNFTMAGVVPANRVARWNGTAWSSLGVGVDADVLVLAGFDEDGAGPNPPALFAGGDFLMAGGSVVVNHVARWNGSAWSDLSGGTDGPVQALSVFDPDGAGTEPASLYAGGIFGFPGVNIASWNGQDWSAQPGGTVAIGAIAALTVLSGGGPPNSGTLFAGGDFAIVGMPGAGYLASFNGSQWTVLDDGTPAGNGLGDEGNAVAVYDDDGNGPNASQLLVGGIASAGGISVNGIATWNGSNWSSFGSGQLGATALTVFDPDGAGPASPVLHGGGGFVAGPSTTLRVAIWTLATGGSWTPLGGNFTGSLSPVISALLVHDADGAGGNAPIVYAGGRFLNAGGAMVGHIAQWNGAAWSGLSSGVTAGFGIIPGISALVLHDEDGPGPNPTRLFAGGNFTTIGGVNTTSIARWNGAAWSTLSSGVANGGAPAVVYALAVFDQDGGGPGLPALFAGGEFNSAGGTGANRIARWNGSSWFALGSGVDGPNVLALTTFDVDGPGSAATELYAGGQFALAGGAGANSIARWNGVSWSPLGSGIINAFSAAVNMLTPFDDDGAGPTLPALYALGFFSNAGGHPSARIARWGCDADAPLPGDSDGDGDVDLDDLDALGDCLTGPNNGPVAPGCGAFDFEPDNDVDLDDVATFQNAFTG